MAYRFRGRDIRPSATGPRVNDDIRSSSVRVIDEDGGQLGVLPIEQALEAAEERDLDLVEVSPNSDPPVCKIMDYGRYKYTQQKKAQEAKKRQRTVELKEVKMRIKIDEHDYEFKKKHAERFLLDGNKAKVTIMFRGREVTHPNLGHKLLDRMANDLLEIGTVEQAPRLEGRNMTMLIAPKVQKQPQGSSGGRGRSEKRSAEEGSESLGVPLAEAMKKSGVAGGELPSTEVSTGDDPNGEEGKKDAET